MFFIFWAKRVILMGNSRHLVGALQRTKENSARWSISSFSDLAQVRRVIRVYVQSDSFGQWAEAWLVSWISFDSLRLIRVTALYSSLCGERQLRQSV